MFTLDGPSFIPFMTYASQRSLREQMYKAHVAIASSGKWDNAPIIKRILELRHVRCMQNSVRVRAGDVLQQSAELLAFKDYASVVLSTRLAKSVNQVRLVFVLGELWLIHLD